MPNQLQQHGIEPLACPKSQVQLPDNVQLGDQIVITFCDCCAAGLQVVHALQAGTSGCSVQTHAAKLTGDLELRPLLSSPADSTPAAFQLVNIVPAGSSKPQVTFACLNSSLQGPQVAHAVAALVSWLQDRQAQHADGTMPAVVVAAAARLQPSPGVKLPQSDLYTLIFNGAALPGGLTSAAALPHTLQLHDALLSTLVHGLYVTGLPTVCLLVPGYKPSVTAGIQDSYSSVQSLANALATAGLLCGAPCSKETVSKLQLLHRWFVGTDTTQGVGEVLYV